MGKVRDHISQDDIAIAQWVYRKVKNHLPMSVRDDKHSRVNRKVQPYVQIIDDGTTVRMVLNNGRVFDFEVRDRGMVEDLVLEAVE